MIAWIPRGRLVDRMIGAAALDENVYEEVEHDPSATSQAALVVMLGAVAAGIGSLSGGLLAFIIGIATALIGWAAYAYVAYWVSTRWLEAPYSSVSWGDLLRTLGFASSPRLFLALGLIPALGFLLSLVVLGWILLTTLVAIHQALDFDIRSALATAVVSWLALILISFVFNGLVGAAAG